MKVLYIIYTLGAGGIETFGVNLFKNIDRKKFKFDFLVIKPNGEKQFYDDVIQSLGGEIIPVGDFSGGKIKKYISYELDILRIMKRGQYDVVHINCGHIHSLPELVFAKMCGIKNVVVHSHNGELTSSARFFKIRCFLQRFYRFFSYRLADHLLTCSDVAANWAFSPKAIAEGLVVQVNNGIAPERYAFNIDFRNTIRDELGLADDLLVGHIGRMNVQKNHSFLLEIFKCIKEKKKDAKLILCGDGDLKEQIIGKAKSLGIIDDVIFYGITDRIPEMLSAMDVFLFPSLFEGLPVVGIEAQASGIPIIASDTITRNVVVSPCWVALSLQDPPEKWAEAVLHAYENNKRIDTSRMIRESGFDIHSTAELIEKVYENSKKRRK